MTNGSQLKVASLGAFVAVLSACEPPRLYATVAYPAPLLPQEEIRSRVLAGAAKLGLSPRNSSPPVCGIWLKPGVTVCDVDMGGRRQELFFACDGPRPVGSAEQSESLETIKVRWADDCRATGDKVLVAGGFNIGARQTLSVPGIDANGGHLSCARGGTRLSVEVKPGTMADALSSVHAVGFEERDCFFRPATK